MKKYICMLPLATVAACLLALLPAAADDGLLSVLKIYSGNSIKLQARTDKDKGIRCRYSGLDVPDRGKPFFELCRNANKALVENRKIKIEPDNQTEQTQGRLWGYVYAGDVFVNAELIKSGYALVAADYTGKYRDLFLQLQQQARKSHSGLWAFEDQSDEPYYVGSKSKKVFHRPSCVHMKGLSFDDRLIFRTKGEALAGGYSQDWRCCPLFKRADQPQQPADDEEQPSAPLRK